MLTPSSRDNWLKKFWIHDVMEYVNMIDENFQILLISFCLCNVYKYQVNIIVNLIFSNKFLIRSYKTTDEMAWLGCVKRCPLS